MAAKVPVDMQQTQINAALRRVLGAGWLGKFDEYRGRDPHPTGAGRGIDGIYHLDIPSLPQYHFEWHPQKRIVYLIRVGQEPAIGEAICHHAETHGDAFNFLQAWGRGFKEGRTPTLIKTDLQL